MPGTMSRGIWSSRSKSWASCVAHRDVLPERHRVASWSTTPRARCRAPRRCPGSRRRPVPRAARPWRRPASARRSRRRRRRCREDGGVLERVDVGGVLRPQTNAGRRGAPRPRRGRRASRVAATWLSSTARRSEKASMPSPGTSPCTAATRTGSPVGLDTGCRSAARHRQRRAPGRRAGRRAGREPPGAAPGVRQPQQPGRPGRTRPVRGRRRRRWRRPMTGGRRAGCRRVANASRPQGNPPQGTAERSSVDGHPRRRPTPASPGSRADRAPGRRRQRPRTTPPGATRPIQASDADHRSHGSEHPHERRRRTTSPRGRAPVGRAGARRAQDQGRARDGRQPGRARTARTRPGRRGGRRGEGGHEACAARGSRSRAKALLMPAADRPSGAAPSSAPTSRPGRVQSHGRGPATLRTARSDWLCDVTVVYWAPDLSVFQPRRRRPGRGRRPVPRSWNPTGSGGRLLAAGGRRGGLL